MAASYLIETSYNGEKFLSVIICSTQVFDKLPPQTGGGEDSGRTTAINAVNFLDDFFETGAWQLSRFPIYPPENFSLSASKIIFPNSVVLSSPPDNAPLEGPKGVIPDASLQYFVQTLSAGRIVSNRIRFNSTKKALEDTDMKTVFPFLTGVASHYSDFDYDVISTMVGVAPDDFIIDGAINPDIINSGDVLKNVRSVQISAWIYTNGDVKTTYIPVVPSIPGDEDYWGGYVPKEFSSDPFDPGGSTPQTPGGTGGTGDFDGSSTDIGIPDEPSISATSSGFISLFNPSLLQLTELSDFMWSDLFDIDTLKKLFGDPMQAILGLSIIPGPIPSAGSSEVKVGNISTGVKMNKAARQYITIDCGSLNVNEYWGAYLDYDPYTKCEIYLPYIGTHAIAADDIMGKTVQVVYRVDILSGACMAYIKCGGSVLYQFAGQCSASVPITGNDWTNVINGTLSVAANIGSLVASGGATAPLAANSLANAAVNQMKPSVEKSGSLSGAAGIMGIQQPYLIITRPRQALPYNQNTYTGYPSLYSVNLSELTGYTEIEKIHLEGIPATEKELTEIDTLLKGGVIF